MKILTIMCLLILVSSPWVACKFEGQATHSFHSKKEVDELLKSELKIGSAKEDVFTILDQHKFRHSDYDPGRKPQIRAILKDISRSFFVSQSVQVELYFDDHQLLESYEVKGIATGP